MLLDATDRLEAELTDLHAQAEQARRKTQEAREQAAAAEIAYREALRQADDEEIGTGADLPEGMALKGTKALWTAWQERLSSLVEAIAGKSEALAVERSKAEKAELDTLAESMPALVDRIERSYATLALVLGEAHDALRRFDGGFHNPAGERVSHPGGQILRRFLAEMRTDRVNYLRRLGEKRKIHFGVARHPTLEVEPARRSGEE
ncbi:MAG: hypothetical protein ACOYXN_13595 [Acidobacteriota bacterium]